MTVAIQERVAIEPSPSYDPEGRMHAADTAGLFPHTARPVRGRSRTMKSEPPSHQLHAASTSNRPHRHLHQLQVRVTGLLLVLALVGIAVGMVTLVSLSSSSHALDVLCAGGINSLSGL